MKKLSKLNLHNLAQSEMAKREQSFIRGGASSPCGCVSYCPCSYAGPQEGPGDSFYGGSSSATNETANATQNGLANKGG